MAMLYLAYGFYYIPDEEHNPQPIYSGDYITNRLKPSTFNQYLSAKDLIGRPLGFINFIYDFDWLKTTSNFYYYLDTPAAYGTGLHYKYLVPNYDCAPINIGQQKKDGTVETLRRSASCYRTDWSEGAMIRLDYDINWGGNYAPPIMKISWTNLKTGYESPSHFVVIGGYEKKDGRADDIGWYRAHNPSFEDNQDNIPKALNGETQYGRKYDSGENKGENMYSFDGMVTLYRFTGKHSQNPLDTSNVDVVIQSPVEVQVIDPDGNMIGYDPETGKKFLENPMSLYYEETPVTALDGTDTDTSSEPYKRLTIIQPRQGNYILKFFGTGDGPYTINMDWTKSDGTANLVTSLTGTATPSMSETYRVIYSPTGDASLSQTNQAPIANAGANQTGEQSYEIALDGSASSDPDGDPLKYTWSFVSKPEGSSALLSNANTVSPTFIPDLPGTYTLQLAVNDYFTDSTPSTITVTATPVQSRISVIPNFSTPLTAGSGIISFDVNNIGRIGVSSGIINISLSDPDGVVVSTGSQAFSIGVGQTTTVSVPVTIPSLKFGNYTLTYTLSDETRTGTPTVVTISNSVLAAFSFDKITYRVRETANLTLSLANTGKFAQENLTVTVTAPDAGYTDTRTVSLNPGSTLLNFAVPVPVTILPGQHSVNVILALPSGSSTMQTGRFALQESSLVLELAGSGQAAGGDIVTLYIENKGAVDTTYAAEKFAATDSGGNVIYQDTVSGSIMAGERKTFAAIPIPPQTARGLVFLNVTVKDVKTGKLSYLSKSVAISGVEASLLARTDKDVYLNTEPITAISTLATGAFPIENGTLNIKVNRYKKPTGGEFVHFLPKTGWMPFSRPYGIAIAPDGSMYVADLFNNRILKFDAAGTLVARWGSYGWYDGQFYSPTGIAVAPDGSVYVTDTGNRRVQKFDSSGKFLAKWGTSGSGDGQFYYPYGIAVAADGAVYVVDSYNHRIQKFDQDGNFLAKWGGYGSAAGQFNYPNGIAVASDGSVYVADGGNHRVQKFDANGNFITKWGSYGSGNGQFKSPYAVTITSDGAVYVADTYNHRIQKFDANGNLIVAWGSYGSNNGQFNTPLSITSGMDNSIYAGDDKYIQKFDGTGKFLAKWGYSNNGDGQFAWPYGIAFAPDGSFYVTERTNSRIQKFDSNGNLVTKWGSYGSGDGQFNSPYSVAVGPAGAVYVADTNNHRIQKFDANGNFVTKWGSYGWGNGQFISPYGVAVGPDGSVYVSDTHNSRIQKFDRNGGFMAAWGAFCRPDSNGDGIADQSCDGLFNYPEGVAVGPDGYVYVADGNQYIQKFDGNGNFILKWGGWGYGYFHPRGVALGPDNSVYVTDASLFSQSIQKFDGTGNFLSATWAAWGDGNSQFKRPQGIAVGPDSAVYVVDSSNHRLQRMEVFSSGSETLFQTTVPIAQPADTSRDYVTDVGVLNAVGKLYLEASLKNNIGQTIAASEYPFSVVSGNVAVMMSTNKKTYKPFETVTITGEVRNLSAIEATNLRLQSESRKSQDPSQTIYTETFNLPAGGVHPFTVTTTAGPEGTLAITSSVSQNNVIMAEITDQYEVAWPALAVTLNGPDIVGRDAFDLTVEIKNTGKADFSGELSVFRGGGRIDYQQIQLSAGETKLSNYTQQIARTTDFRVSVLGDAMQAAMKTITYGEGAAITIGSGGTGQGSSVYPEGRVTLPVTITNTGQIGETLTVEYTLGQGSGGQGQETRSYYLPAGASLTDTLSYELTAGNYQVSAVSSQPGASAQASFSVLKESVVTMTTVPGSQGANGLIPVTMTLTNSGYNEINGAVQLAVVNNDGKNVWRGEAQVSGLSSQASTSVSINVDPAGLAYGVYPITTALYSTSGMQLAASEARIRTEGPVFEITALPNNPAFTVGRDGSLAFTIKNSGTQQGEMSFTAKAMDILNSSVREVLQPGQEKTYAFTFAVPEDAEEKGYSADYALASTLSQGTKGAAAFQVSQVKVGVTASLDKDAYRNGETAVLTMTVTKQSATEDGTYVAIIRYGAHHDMQSFTLSAQPTTLTFNVPLTEITGENLFYGIHFESGTAIYRSSLFINAAQADLAADLSALTTGITVQKDNTVNLVTKITNYGKGPTTATTVSLYDGDPSTSSGRALIDTKAVSALNPQGTDTVTVPWNVLGKAGEHTITAVVDPQDTVIEYSEQNNTTYTKVQVPDLTVFTETDKDTYKTRQKVYITSTLTNLTAEKTYSNLLLLTSAKDGTGQEVYAKSIALGSLQPTASATNSEAWSTAGLTVDGSYTITQRVFAGSDQVTQSTKQVTLEKAPDFVLGADVNTRRVKQGEKAAYTAVVEPFNGWNHEVIFSMDGLPSRASVTFTPDRLIPPAQAQAEVATTDATPAGTHTLYLSAQGTDEGEIVTRSVPLTLDVTAFALETATPSLTIKQLETAAFPINITSLNGYEGSVSLSVTGLPTGVRASLDTTTAQTPGSANLTVVTSKYARPGTYTLAVAGNDGLVSHTLNLTLVLQPNPAISAGIIATPGPGPQNDALVKIFNSNRQLIKEFTAFSTEYGATSVSADIDGDGYDEVIVAEGPGPKNTAALRAYTRDGRLMAEYTAFSTTYGLSLAAADLDGDWIDELLVGMGPGPRNAGTLKVLKYSGTGFTEVMTQDVYPDMKYGVNIAAGDIDGDGLPEIITAPGPGPDNPATITVWKFQPAGLAEINTFTAFEGSYGVNVSAGDVDGDGKDEVIAGAGPDPKNTALVRIYRPDGSLIKEFAPYDSKHAYGVTVSAGDLDGNGAVEIITGPGPGPQNEPRIKAFKADGTELENFLAYPAGMDYGVRVSAGKTGQ